MFGIHREVTAIRQNQQTWSIVVILFKVLMQEDFTSLVIAQIKHGKLDIPPARECGSL